MTGHWNGPGTNERGSETVARNCVASLQGNHRFRHDGCNGRADEGVAFEVAA